MRIVLILEGSYPYVQGGVSSWTHDLIASFPQHEFVLWTICTSEQKGNFLYTLADHVSEVREVCLLPQDKRI